MVENNYNYIKKTVPPLKSVSKQNEYKEKNTIYITCYFLVTLFTKNKHGNARRR